jgi:CRISPR/Cas system Type II protein with McrA/HNH and RuvC-like nuclease domain
MKSLETKIKEINSNFKNNEVTITFLERNEFQADVSINIIAEFFRESIDIIKMSDKEYCLFSTSTNFPKFECKSIDDVIVAITKRIEFSQKISGVNFKSADIDLDKINILSNKYGFKIKAFQGATIISHENFNVLCNIEKELMFLTVGIKTVEVPFIKVKETLDSLSLFEAVN